MPLDLKLIWRLGHWTHDEAASFSVVFPLRANSSHTCAVYLLIDKNYDRWCLSLRIEG